MEIYWVKNKERQGPASVIDVISLLEAGELTETIKAWHKGCEQWMPLSELPVLSSHFERKEAQNNAEKALTQDFSPELERMDTPITALPSTPRVIVAPAPVLRFWARMVDLLLYTVLYLGVLRILNLPFNILYFTPFMWLPYCLLEGWALHTWKITPGKWLLGICVTNLQNETLSFVQATKRCVLALVLGLGFMLGWITVIMAFFSWLSVRKNLMSYWDRKTPALTQATGNGGGMRIVLAAVIIFLLFQILGWLLMPWNEEIMSLSKNLPEFLKWE